jgi:predicted DNA-binding transcriptional regulator AlpA
MPKKDAPVTGRRLYTRKQAAELLNVSEATLDRWAHQLQGPPFVKLGDAANSHSRYPSDLMDEYIEKRLTRTK